MTAWPLIHIINIVDNSTFTGLKLFLLLYFASALQPSTAFAKCPCLEVQQLLNEAMVYWKERLPPDFSDHPTVQKVFAENKSVTHHSLANNEKFIEIMNDPNYEFFVAELGPLKELNDGVLGKDPATLFGNWFQNKVFNKCIEAGLIKPDGTGKIVATHSSYKGLFVAIKKGDPKTAALVNKIIEDSKKEFVTLINSTPYGDFIKEKTEDNRLHGFATDPGHWWRSGTGDTPDKAAHAARLTGRLGDNWVKKGEVLPSVSWNHQDSIMVQKKLLTEIEDNRTNIQSTVTKMRNNPKTGPEARARIDKIFEPAAPGSTKLVPSEDLGGAYRKVHGVDFEDKITNFQKEIRSKFGVALDRTTVKQLANYFDGVDVWTLSPIQAGRFSNDFGDSVEMVLGGDAIGLGGMNYNQVSKQLALSHDGSLSTKSLEAFLKTARQGELEATKKLKRNLEYFASSAEKVGIDRKSMVVSGDDITIKVPGKKSPEEIKQFLGELGKNPEFYGKYRVAMVDGTYADTGQIVPPDVRQRIHTNLETLLKDFMGKIAGKVSSQELDGLVISTRITLKENGPARIEFYVSSKKDTEKVFNKIIKQINKSVIANDTLPLGGNMGVYQVGGLP